MPQQPALYSKLTVRENLDLFARLEGVPDPESTVAAMLELAALEDRADDQVGELSGGNRQRVNVAIGLLAEPEVLLLDEPSAALDPRQRERLWEFILRLAGRGTTVLYSTHNVQEAERHAQQVFVLADGERLFAGSPRELERVVEAEGGAGGRRLRGGVRLLPAQPGPLSAPAPQGPADPAPLAAAGGAARDLPGGDLRADRLRALARARQGRDRHLQRRARSPPARSTWAARRSTPARSSTRCPRRSTPCSWTPAPRRSRWSRTATCWARS